MNRRHLLTVAAAGLLLAGCAQTRRSTALSPELGRAGIRLQRSLPAVLPSGAQVLPKTQLVLLPAESAAGLLVPVPFLAEAVVGALDRSEAATEAAQLASSPGLFHCLPTEGCCIDEDDDNHGQGVFCQGLDCNDDNEFVYPGADELCNGEDDDCDGIDDDMPVDCDVAAECVDGSCVSAL